MREKTVSRQNHALSKVARGPGPHTPCTMDIRVPLLKMSLCADLRYSSRTARSRLGPVRVVGLFVLWWETTPLDPCACEINAERGNTRRTYDVLREASLKIASGVWGGCTASGGVAGGEVNYASLKSRRVLLVECERHLHEAILRELLPVVLAQAVPANRTCARARVRGGGLKFSLMLSTLCRLS